MPLETLDDTLFWARECLPLVKHLPVLPVHQKQLEALFESLGIECVNKAMTFYRTHLPQGDLPEDFWLRYGWLVCIFSSMDDNDARDLLYVFDKQETYEGSDKSWFWDSRMNGTPFPYCSSMALLPGDLQIKMGSKMAKRLRLSLRQTAESDDGASIEGL